MDTSSHIKAIISGSCTYEDSDEIIGEIQFCFLTGMLIGNAACMEQWVRSILTAHRHHWVFFSVWKPRVRSFSRVKQPRKPLFSPTFLNL
jgi:AAR2 protein